MSDLDLSLERKYQRLQSILAEMGSTIVAMSSGVDSVLLAKVAADVLGDNALAVTAESATLPRRELKQAAALAETLGLNHRILHTNEITDPHYASNPVNRCYFCKLALFDQLNKIKVETRRSWICSGENIDDLSDHRPGVQAGNESGVRAPLQEVGLTKLEIRALARALGLPNWDKPASTCLATRIPFGEQITLEKLAQVESAEDFLIELGFRLFRVRHHGSIARIEVESHQMGALCGQADQITSRFQQLGFQFTTMDLAGYRRGSLIEAASVDRSGENPKQR